MLDIYSTLEISKIIEKIIPYSYSEISKERLSSLKMISSQEELKRELAKLEEMSSLIYRHDVIPFSNSFDLSKYIDLANKGGILTPLEISHFLDDITLSKGIFKYFKKVERSKYPLTFSLVDNLNDLSSLEEKINKVISPNLSIKDDASKELGIIRRRIKAREDEVHILVSSLILRYKDNLVEPSYSLRNGHYVLPVKTSLKSKVSGIIHDVSDSGQTSFIEPNSLVELSNEIYLLKNEEKEEIQRLLKLLTCEIASDEKFIIENNNIIAELDFVSSKARFANDSAHLVADLVDEPLIDLKGAKHPLIDKNKVVANSFYLDSKNHIIVISGPNAGGKSVALKTVGLLVMMNQMGLALPTSVKARLSFFPKIFADIGDNQSLAENLSTFAAHISNISTITHYVSKDSLVLIDELGTGTSPNEGEAIALAVLNYLTKKGTFAIISSHFDKVKEFAYSKEGIINAMMVFDEKKLVPTYVLKVGLPGRSYGLEMAKRYHLDDDIIKDAKGRLTRKNNDVNTVIDNLTKSLKENEELKEKLGEERRLFEVEKSSFNKEKEELRKQKQNLLDDVNEIKEEMIYETTKKINEVIKHLPKNDEKRAELTKLKEGLEKEIENDITFDENIKVGDYVKIENLDLVGKVKAVKGEKLVLITSDGASVKTSKKQVRLTSEPIMQKIYKYNVDEMSKIKMDVGLELNIIGLHIDEAKIAIENYLSDSLMKHFHQVRIVHGKGSGALRKLTHDILKTKSFVSEYHLADYATGGDGATIVIFK